MGFPAYKSTGLYVVAACNKKQVLNIKLNANLKANQKINL